MTVTFKEYESDKKRFFTKHNYNYECETSPMDEYGVYHKVYTFKDGATWYETMMPTYEKTEVEIKKVIVKVEVKMLRTEYWSSEAGSKYYYEQF